MSKKSLIVPMSDKPKRINIPLTDAEHRALFNLARRSQTSASALAHLAVSQLLVLEQNGALPMIQPSTVYNATFVPGLEQPLSVPVGKLID